MVRPRLLDLFCGAGGCSVGYHRAGFDVVGIDIEAHPDYPTGAGFEFIQADVRDVLTDLPFLRRVDVRAGSPPCPRFSSMTKVTGNPEDHPDMLTPTRAAFLEAGGPYVIENVPGAPMPTAVLLCGKAMGLSEIRRHRLFESNRFLMSPGCGCDYGPAYGVYGDHGDKNPTRPHPDGAKRWGKARDIRHAQQIMGIDWMTRWDDLADAIPPAYTEYIGAQLLDQLVTT